MKIVNVILGLGAAIIVGALINLGIKAFHPQPASPDYSYPKIAPMPYGEFNCDKADAKCITDRDAYYKNEQVRQDEFQKAQKEYDAKMGVYNRDVFVIANIVGIAVFIVGFWLLFATAIVSESVPIGIMIAGLYGIIYGYAIGWNSTDDRLKFFVGLAVAVLVIGGSIWLMQRYGKKSEVKT